MEKVLLTVVISAYNVDKYLHQCMKGLIDDRLSEAIEVIIVNDGSTDNTSTIAETYSGYSNVRIINKENGGLASVFNAGIREAKGKYWLSLDGDDAINTEEMVSFIGEIRDINVDLIVFPKTVFDDSREKREQLVPSKPGLFLYEDEVLDPPFIHNSVYLTQMLKEHVLVEEEFRLYADGPFVLYTIPHINNCISVDRAIYRYRYSQEQSVSVRSLIRNKKDLYGTTWNMIDFYIHNYYVSKKRYLLMEKLIYARIRTMYFIALFENDMSIYELNEQLLNTAPGLYEKSPYIVKIIRSNISPVNWLIRKMYTIGKSIVR